MHAFRLKTKFMNASERCPGEVLYLLIETFGWEHHHHRLLQQKLHMASTIVGFPINAGLTMYVCSSHIARVRMAGRPGSSEVTM